MPDLDVRLGLYRRLSSLSTKVELEGFAAELIDRRTGETMAVASRLNPQTVFGDDVISRIRHASETTDGPIELQEHLTRAIDAMLDELASDASLEKEEITELTIAGNTTMQHALCRLDMTELGHLPVLLATTDAMHVDARALGISPAADAKG